MTIRNGAKLLPVGLVLGATLTSSILVRSVEAAPAFRKTITINPGKVAGGPLTNFPFLFNTTDPALRTTANGGTVTNVNGWDIIFATSPTCADSTSCGGAKLDHEIERYNGTTGELVAWVRVPSIDDGTVIYLHYSDPAVVATTENRPGVWNSGYKGVWHLKETPPAVAIDSTSNANNGTPEFSPIQTAGPIDGSLQFDGTNERDVNVPNSASLQLPSTMTVEAWARTASADGQTRLIIAKWNTTGSARNYWLGKLDSANFAFYVDMSQGVGINLGLVNDGTWHHFVGVADAGLLRLYVDGVQQSTAVYTGTSQTGTSELRIGRSPDLVLQDWDGGIDEVRVSNAARPAGWIATEYANQSSPSTFYTVEAMNVLYRSIGTAGPHSAGTITATVGSPVVTGVATGWRTANRGRGDSITFGGFTGTILSVDSETQLTLTSPSPVGGSPAYTISRKFLTLAAWETCIDGGGSSCGPDPLVPSNSLVADSRSEVGIAYDDSVLARVSINGSVTDATHTITLTADSGNRHLGVAGGGVVVDGASGSLPVVLVDDDFVNLEWLEIKGGLDEGVEFQSLSPGNNQCVARNLLVHNTTRDGILIDDTGANVDVYNNIVYANAADGIRIGTALTAGTVRIFNNTVYGNTGGGITASGSNPTAILRNNISHSNGGAEFSVAGLNAASSNNLSSDATATSVNPAGDSALWNNVLIGDMNFVNAPAGDLHIQSGSRAENNGADLSSVFSFDIDGDPRVNPWDIGADEFDGGGGGGPTISSAGNQSFTVGGPTLPAALITITEDPATPIITAANDLRIRIPAGFPMKFDSAQTSLSISGPAALKVATTVTYEDLDRTVVLNVLSDFGVNDWITVDFLRFWSFTAPAPADNLELEVGNDGVVSATDDKTITIVPDVGPTLSSEDHQVFVQFQPPAAALPFTVSEGTSSTIVPGNDILIRIPAGFNMTWDPGAALSFGGPAAAKVTLPVSYPDAGTLRIPVTASFLTGDYVTVSGARFQGFAGVSASSNLVLDLGAFGDVDDKTIEIVAASDVKFLTATAKDLYVKLEWWQSAAGLCDAVLIMRRDDGVEPTGPTDPLALPVDYIFPCPSAGAKAYREDPLFLSNGTLYAYAVFVEYSGGTYTAGEFVKARPVDPLVSPPVQWAYSTGATAMAPPGLRFSAGESYVYAVSNDSILHSMKGGSTGGDWPSSWKPYQLGLPAQARPPVVSVPIGSATAGAALLGSQDGNVYAINAVDGSEAWKRSISAMVQAAPAGHLGTGTFNIVIAGTRDSDNPNSLVALDKNSGVPVWTFTNAAGQGGDGKEIGIISGSASIHYPSKRAFFASRIREGINGSSDTLWSVDFSSGSPVRQWSLPLGNIDGSPVVWGNAVYVGTVAGIVYAVDLITPTGTVNWSCPIGDGAVKGFVFPQRGTSPLRLLVSTTGKVTSIEDLGLSYGVAWQLTPADIPGPKTPIFVPGTGRILVGSSDGNLYQVDAFTPALRTSVELGDGSSAVGVPTVDILKSMIYVGTDEGVIYGITFPLP